jgi:hypothetical protein
MDSHQVQKSFNFFNQITYFENFFVFALSTFPKKQIEKRKEFLNQNSKKSYLASLIGCE